MSDSLGTVSDSSSQHEGNQLLTPAHLQHASRPYQSRVISLATMVAVLSHAARFALQFCVILHFRRCVLKEPTICTDADGTVL